MGMEILVPRPHTSGVLPALLDALAAGGFRSSLIMVDGQLVMPNAPPPPAWRDVRLRTPGGTVTLARREGGIAVVVFGNADDALRAAQLRIADALRSLA